MPVGCSFDHKQQSANCKFTFSTLDNTESLFTGVDQLLLQANHVDLMILSTKRTIQVSDKHISVSHMHNCLLISGRWHGSDDPEHKKNNPSVRQTHFSQSYAQVLTHFRPTTWIWWSQAWTEQTECLTTTFQSIICTSAYLFQANDMDLMILSMNRTSRVSDKHISVSDMRNCLFISGQPQMHLSHNIIRNYMPLYPKKTSNLMDLMIPSINKTSNCQLIC